jgi:hypothetical protein
MSIKKKVTGSGFTKTKRVVYSFPLEQDEEQALKDTIDAHEDDLDMIERNCRAILSKAGLPDSERRLVIWQKDGKWREAPDGFDTPGSPGEEISGLISQIGEGCRIPEDSPEGYAARMLQRLMLVRSAIQRNAAEKAAREALLLGALWREMEMKIRIEPVALRGVSFEEGPRGPRLDALGRAIAKVLKYLGGEASSDDVWKALLARANGGAPFDDQDDDAVYDAVLVDFAENESGYLTWRSTTTGAETTIQKGSFVRRVNRLKNKFSTLTD